MNDAISAEQKALSMLGLAAKAGYIAGGEFAATQAIKEGKACLVLVASDASDNTKKLFTDKCSFYHVPVYVIGSKDMLGRLIGKEERASVAITNQGMADAIRNKIDNLRQSDVITEG